jgi:hypothetical protein
MAGVHHPAISFIIPMGPSSGGGDEKRLCDSLFSVGPSGAGLSANQRFMEKGCAYEK